MSEDTPAITAHKKSVGYVTARDKEKWVALFDENAVVYDPVGPSPHDPEGKGFRGREAISAFWDIAIAPLDLIAVPHKRIACGNNTVAVIMTVTNNLNGIKTYIEMVAVYTVNDAGKLVSLRAYWDAAALAEQMTTVGMRR